MRTGWRAAVAAVFVWVGVAALPAASFGGASSSGGGGGPALSPLSGPLTIAGSPSEGEQLNAFEQSALLSPRAVAAREASKTAFEGLSDARAREELAAAFPQMVDQPAGGPPHLPPGQHAIGFATAHAELVDLGAKQRGVVESTAPLAIGNASGGFAPVNLGLREAGGAFEPKRPLVDVRIPKRVGNGVALPGLGVSLTPLGESGGALGGADGVVQGAVVSYANVETDTDALAKPTSRGFALDAVLRSVHSPQRLAYRVDMPEGARLTRGQGPNEARVVKEGVTLAVIAAPGAHDAVGQPVPVGMTVAGDVVTLLVNHRSGAYRYPIEMDPETYRTASEGIVPGNWHFYGASHGYEYEKSSSLLTMSHKGSFPSGNWEYVFRTTNGDTKIYEFIVKDELWPTFISSQYEYKESTYPYLSAWITIFNAGGEHPEKTLSGTPIVPSATLCANGACSAEGGAAHNEALFELNTNESSAKLEAEGLSNLVPYGGQLSEATVFVAQPAATHSTVTYNKEAPELKYMSNGKEEKTFNLFYQSNGEGVWLGPRRPGAFEITAKDVGLGVSWAGVEVESAGKWEVAKATETNYLTQEGACIEIQCAASQSKVLTYASFSGALPSGQDKIRASAHDPFSGTSSSEHNEGEATVWVDSQAPHGIVVSGLASKGEELELGEIPGHVAAEATDGEGTVRSSGVEYIKLAVDGREIKPSTNGGWCQPGPCKAKQEWAINGAELGAGYHTLTVQAVDRANNVATKEYGLNVYSASPTAIGPGSVNPESGDFALEAADVSISGGTGGLGLSRHYDSRNLIEGVEGPLGPQWSVSLGSLASLEVLPDGSAMVVGPTGITHFALKKGGGFEAPAGDQNLTLKSEENGKKEVVAYILEDAKDHTSTKFTLPTGAKSWMPETSTGAVATDTVTDKYRSVEQINEFSVPAESGPYGIALGADKNLWFTDNTSGKIGKITPAGVLTEYSTPAGGALAGIALGPDNKLWYLNSAHDTVGSISLGGEAKEYALASAGPAAIAAGPDGNLWFTTGSKIGKVTTSGAVTEYALPAETIPSHIVAGKDGNLWFTNDYCGVHGSGLCAIGKITTSGAVTEYKLPSTAPTGIASGSDGNLWFAGTHSTEAKIGRITVMGEIVEYTVTGGGRPQEIAPGPDGNLWFTEQGTEKIGKITTSGVVSQYSLPEGSSPYGIAAGSEGNLWFTDSHSNRVGTMTPTGVIVEPTLEVAPHPSATCEVGKLEKGCRALEFVYAEKTTATGENESEWGEYRGRLMKAVLHAYNPTSKAMGEKTLAEYAFDRLGRLRAVWNPEVSSTLKTTYGYDPAGHVTAMTPPGQEPWAFNYAVTAEDATGGRLTSVERGGPSVPLEAASAAVNTTLPTVSANPEQGRVVEASTGAWTHNPVGYTYQWELCSLSGYCYPIVGATNREYRPAYKDEGNALRVVVGATNADGTTYATSSMSGEIPIAPAYLTSYGSAGTGSGQFKEPSGLRLDPVQNELDVADTGNNRVQRITVCCGVATKTFGSEGTGSGQFKHPWDVLFAAELEREYTELVTDQGNNRVEGFSLRTGLDLANTSTGLGPRGIAMRKRGSGENLVYVADNGANEVVEYENGPFISEFGLIKPRAFGSAGTGNGQFKGPSGVALDGSGNIYVVDTGNNRVEEFDKERKYLSQFGMPGEGERGEFNEPEGIAIDENGNIFVADTGNNRVQEFDGVHHEVIRVLGYAGTGAGQFKRPVGIAVGEGRYPKLYITDSGNDRVQEWAPGTEVPNAPELPVGQPSPWPSSMWSMEYNVPASGTAAPYQLGTKEVEAWGQKDDPVWATAIFPPDSPQSIPAERYVRATVLYLDARARQVNVASPLGGISTTEYNNENEVERSLSAANRAQALKEANPAAAAKELDTESFYNTEGMLERTVGPMHTAKIVSGKEGKPEEAKVRNRVKYYYDEGAPTEPKETYDLVTKIEDSAENAAKELFDTRVATTSYSGQNNAGWKLRRPTSSTIDPNGLKLTSTTVYEENSAKEPTENIVETTGPMGSAQNPPPAYSSQLGSNGGGNGQFAHPFANAVDSSGNIWVVDGYNSRVQKFSSSGAFLAAYGTYGSSETEVQFKEPVGLAINQSTGNVYVGDQNNNRVVELSSSGAFVRVFGKLGEGAGQFKEADGVAIDSKGNVWVTDYANNRVQEFNENGEFLAALGWGVSNGESKLEVCTSGCRAGIGGSNSGQFSGPGYDLVSGGNLFVSDNNNGRVDEFNEKQEFVRTIGSKGSGSGQMQYPAGLAADSAGNVYVADSGNSRIDEFTATGTPIQSFGVKGSGNGQFSEPEGITVLSSGVIWVSDSANGRLEKWVSGGGGARTGRTVYYTAKGEAPVTACREHIEWVNLPCETEPVKQPETGGLPSLPVTTTKYNMWDQPESVEEKFGSVTRTRTTTYDAGGRPVTTEETSANGHSVPKVTNTYNATNGTLEKQSTSEEPAKTITTLYDRLGRLESYSDADGNATTYTYDVDGRVTKASDGSGEGKGEQTYTYSTTTGMAESLVDSAAGTFKASYDVAGRMLSENYPNGMIACYTYNSVGAAASLEYKKKPHCSESATPLFTDTVVSGVHGEMLKQQSTLAEEPSYTYDAAGRLTQVQEKPAEKGCTTRVYTYDEGSDRTSLTTRAPGAEGQCTSEGGTTEYHTYDVAGRLDDAGIEYEPFGNITKLPSSDAGGGEGSEIVSSYYANGQLYQQTQRSVTHEYLLDPEDRVRETKTGSSSLVSHFDGPGSAVAWETEGVGKWTRNIAGIDGGLAGTQTATATTLMLHDLSGNVVGTIGDSESETTLSNKYNSTEFGVPQPGTTPPKYSWLGASGVTSEGASGLVVKDGVTYVPLTGKPLTAPQSLAPGLPSNFATPYVSPTSSAAAEYVAATAAQQVAAREEEVRKQEEAAKPAGEVPGMPFMGSTEGEAICTGSGACGASTIKCSTTVRFGEPELEVLVLGALTRCNKTMQTVKLEVCFFEQREGIYEEMEEGCSLEIGHNTNKAYTDPVIEHCEVGKSYEAWVWGYAKSGKHVYVSGKHRNGEYTQPEECKKHMDAGTEAFLEWALESALG